VTQMTLTRSNGMTQVFGRPLNISRVSLQPVGLQNVLCAHAYAQGASQRVVRACQTQSGVMLADILEPLWDGRLAP
jgi:hypothetical protein